MLTLVPPGTEEVMNAFDPMVAPSPITVSPPKMEAPE